MKSNESTKLMTSRIFLKTVHCNKQGYKRKKTMMSHAYICLQHILLLEYVRIMTTIALKQKHVKIFHMDFAKPNAA